MRRGAVLALVLLAADPSRAASPRPVLVADLPDDVLAAVARTEGASASAAATLGAVFAAAPPYLFPASGLNVLTDRRWFEAASTEGAGAPILEIRRWPGDTVLAFYEMPAAGEIGTGLPEGLQLGAKRGDVLAWSCRDAELAAARGDYEAVWCESRVGETRRLGALGVPGDAGLGAGAVADMKEAIFGVLRGTKAEATAPAAIAAPLVPELGEPPRAADERKQGWGSFQGYDFTLGLPPGVRAARLDAGVPAPRPMPYAVAWLRGRFDDRNGIAVAIGDAQRAGYVAVLDPPDEAWRAGVAPPLGARGAERADEAKLDDTVLEWTGASRAVVSHWKQEGFAGDWLVFRLLVAGRGVEIGLPVVTGWRSLALFWIPVTYRGAGRAPAPPPIDPAASLGIRFDKLRASEAKRLALLEGYLTVADLRMDVPRGFWPIANLGSRDGLPVTFVDLSGNVLGLLERRSAGSADLTPSAEGGWTQAAKPSAQHAAAIWFRPNGAAVLVAKDGHGYLLVPNGDSPERVEAWRRMRESADFLKTARH
jgi:hypothetical protein